MANGQEILDKLELEKEIESWSDQDKFIARQLYDIKVQCGACQAKISDHDRRLGCLETTGPAAGYKFKQQAAGAGIATAIISAIVAALHALGYL
jgi:hypothetical protein